MRRGGASGSGFGIWFTPHRTDGADGADGLDAPLEVPTRPGNRPPGVVVAERRPTLTVEGGERTAHGPLGDRQFGGHSGIVLGGFGSESAHQKCMSTPSRLSLRDDGTADTSPMATGVTTPARASWTGESLHSRPFSLTYRVSMSE